MNTSTCAAVAPGRTRQATRWSGRARSPLRWVLVLMAAGGVSGGLAACGGGDPSSTAGTLLNQTLSTHRPVASGKFELFLALAGAPGGPRSSLHLTGRFQAAGAGRLPNFALTLGLNRRGRDFAVGAVSTRAQLFLQLGGAWFPVPPGTAQALASGYAQGGTAPTGSRSSALATIGMDPASWLTSPRLVGSANVAGEDTVQILARVDASRFLADAQKLSGALTPLTGAQLSDPLSLAHISTGPHPRGWVMQVSTGAHDHILRRLALGVPVVILTPTAGNPLAGRGGRLELGTLTFTLAVAHPNQPQLIAAPGNTQPLSALGPAFERLSSGRGPVPR
ncbi:MAG: hypothetical protein JWN81_392 [Solirubrobacterales bacterium]|nr:hypothetical protein [Solirubrobacterales bacterium]